MGETKVSGETDSRETWRPIEKHPGYEVSDLGRVRSPKGRIIGKPSHMRGYSRVVLPGHDLVMVHQLVARAFIGDGKGAVVIHIDRDPQNNRADNLRYGTTPIGEDWKP